MSKTIIVTGGCGFIGSHVVEHLMKNTDWNIIVIDKLSYASKGLEKLRDAQVISNPRLRVFTYDLINPISTGLRYEIGQDIDYIYHAAAETHVDTSISDPVLFIQNNIMSTVNILEYARSLSSLKAFVFQSTDECYGSAPGDKKFKETDQQMPGNPYSASKSAGEGIALAYFNTFKVPVMITNMMNAYGERQDVEKFLPKCIKYITEGRPLFIHADPTCKVPGARSYIHARNVASALLFVINHGTLGERYNICGEQEMNNLELAQLVADHLGKPLNATLTNFHGDRPGHDLRYALDGTKMFDLGWRLPVAFEESVRRTIDWYMANPKWLEEP